MKTTRKRIKGGRREGGKEGKKEKRRAKVYKEDYRIRRDMEGALEGHGRAIGGPREGYGGMRGG